MPSFGITTVCPALVCSDHKLRRSLSIGEAAACQRSTCTSRTQAELTAGAGDQAGVSSGTGVFLEMGGHGGQENMCLGKCLRVLLWRLL